MTISNSDDKISETPWRIRPASALDIPFIYSSWLKSFKHDSALGKSMRSSIYFEQYREVIDQILEDSQTFVAHLPDEPNVIIGYIVFESYASIPTATIHYAFVKESFRRIGVFTSLLKLIDYSKPWQYTHKTNTLIKVLGSDTDWIYNPLYLYKTYKD